MTDFTAAQARAGRPGKSPTAAGETVTVRGKYAVTTTGAELDAAGDRIFMCWLPAQCVPVDLWAVVPDLDSGTGLSLSIGLENADGAGNDDHEAFVTAQTAIGQTAAGILRVSDVGFADIVAADTDRRVYVRAGAGATTLVAGTISLWLSYVTADRDD